jgi:DNA-binding response OmpR family regulator
MNPKVIETSPCGVVLVVDDEEFNRQLLRDSLEVQGHKVIEAQNGSEALHTIAENLPDAVLLDVMMPNMDGFQVCRRIKADPKLAHIPVLMVTALTDRKERLMGIQSGANDFLSKPIDITDVVLRVRNAIQTKQLFDQLQQTCKQLKDLESLRDKLIHLILREVSNPVGDVIGILGPLAQGASGKLDANEAQSLHKAHGTLVQLSAKLGSLLNVSRLQGAGGN